MKLVRKILVACLILGVSSCLYAQDLALGRTEPPYVEGTVTMPTRLIYNAEKRADMVADLAEKSEMNYRLLALKVMEKWQSSIRSDKEFLKNIRKCKTVSFTVPKTVPSRSRVSKIPLRPTTRRASRAVQKVGQVIRRLRPSLRAKTESWKLASRDRPVQATAARKVALNGIVGTPVPCAATRDERDSTPRATSTDSF